MSFLVYPIHLFQLNLKLSGFMKVTVQIGIEIAIENRCQSNVSRADFDPDTDSDFEFGWNPKVELDLIPLYL
jgi:hypothetical protein